MPKKLVSCGFSIYWLREPFSEKFPGTILSRANVPEEGGVCYIAVNAFSPRTYYRLGLYDTNCNIKSGLSLSFIDIVISSFYNNKGFVKCERRVKELIYSLKCTDYL
jgi:hypothetical protein